MKFNKILVDVYSVIYRWTFNKNREEFVVKLDNIDTHLEGVVGFLNAIDTYINKYGDNNTEVFFLLDNMSTIYDRKDISDIYKENRKKNQPPEWFYKNISMVELILKYYRDNSHIIRISKYEADDLVKPILNMYCKKEDKVLLISEDSDWCRYLSENVMQYKSHKIFTTEIYKDTFGYFPTETSVRWDKTIYGDDADNVIGCLKNYPRQFFLKEIEKYDNILDFIRDVELDKISYLDTGWKLKIKKEKANIITNWKLVSALDVSNDEILGNIFDCSFKENKLKIIYSSLSILGKVDNRIKIESKSQDIWNMIDGEPLSRS